MTLDISKNINLKFKGLGIYQVVGGAIGFGLTIWTTAQTGTITGLILLVLLIAYALYSYSIFCGILLLKKKMSGLNYSLINQFLQLINFAILGFAFKYISGVYLCAGIDINTLDFKLNFGVSTWQININHDKELLEVYFNFIAMFLIIMIDKLKKKVVEWNNKTQLSQVGQ